MEPSWWGPRIWRVLHVLAERADIDWPRVLAATSALLPCERCRDHLRRTVPATSENIRDLLWASHNAVRGSDYPRERLATDYTMSDEDFLVLVTEIATVFRLMGSVAVFEWYAAVVSTTVATTAAVTG